MSDVRRPVAGDPVDVALAAVVLECPAAQVIDVGGGSGTRAVPLASLGCRVTVVDSSADALAILQSRARDAGVADRVHGVQADAERLGTVVRSGHADLVLCHHLLEAVDDPAAVVAGIAVALRPGGRASVLVAGRLGAVLGQLLAGRYAEARAILTDPDGRFGSSDPLCRRFEPGGIADLLTRVGLQVESVTGLGLLDGLVTGGVRYSSSGTVGALADLEALMSEHRTLRDIAPDLHVLARRPTLSDPPDVGERVV